MTRPFAAHSTDAVRPISPIVILVLAIVAAAIVSGNARAQTVTATGSVATGTAHDDSVAAILRDAVQRGTLNGLRWPRFPHYRDELEALYEGAGWRPLWSANGRPTVVGQEAIEVLRSASDRALHPEDYDAAALESRFRELSSAHSSSARATAWFDVALSVGFLRHVSDVRIGRVNPKNLSVGINVEPKKLDLAYELRLALDRGHVAGLIRAAEPRYVQYRKLLDAYQHYAKLAAEPSPPPIVAATAVRPGDRFEGTAAVRRRLAITGDLRTGEQAVLHHADTTHYDTTTAAAVARFQERHGLASDGVLGPATVAAINVPFAKRQHQLELAIERIRWLPVIESGPFIVVNVPTFELYAFDTLGTTGAPSLTMNVVVGKAQLSRQTPMFERDMRYIVFRPYWVITRSIIKNETLPAARRNSGYLARNNMEIYSGSGDTGPAVPTTSANLNRVARGDLGIRQRPGPKNSLGLAKFIFPNDHNVYMHGTPATELFERTRRDFSHGCIRLQDPTKLAVWVLRDPREWPAAEVKNAMDAERPRRVDLQRPLPVVIYYTTALVRQDGSVSFLDDIYGHDAKLESALSKGYPFPP